MKRISALVVLLAFAFPLLASAGFLYGVSGLDSLEIRTIEVKGSIAPDGTVLHNSGDGIWQNTVTLDKPVTGDYRGHSIFFTINDVDTLKIQRVPGTRHLLLPGQNGKSEAIRLNNGVYDITLDLNRQEYSVCADVDPYKISVFGSSVANGQGATDFKGYAYMFGRQLEKRFSSGESEYPFQISGVSIGGNTTTKLLRRYDDLINDFSHFVIIGLSLGNEGIHNADDPEKVFEKFSQNMLDLIAGVRADGKEPVVVNNYTRGDYNEADYSYIKRMNLLIHQWDVPSVNVLGAIDDRAGHWAQGCIADKAHPNTAGHEEFMHAFVPSLFDALMLGKPLPQRDMTRSYVLTGGKVISFQPEGTVHPFTVSMRVRGLENGVLLELEQEDDSVSTGRIVVDSGDITYYSPLGGGVSIGDAALDDGEWHDVTLTHYYALGKTILYLDDRMIGEIDEHLLLGGINIGDRDDERTSRSISEIFFWRSALNCEEVAAHHNGAMLKSSLEIYSPLNVNGYSIENKAQSMNKAVVK